ncbi:ras GEF [Coniophora puteana RWD-64-598 SS2]|uniref:Ras GEF n=1 Tax=Coniophora puteana (strain RWD-64-598) TaxID=741705 RepID=A0A5M3MPI2_CONPW|nr:ras GEF [Coniophora puteana RWD-64-598 SS2]EIW81023.1 ras GEF [Coniophora puteana RWD-64-598 SS2]
MTGLHINTNLPREGRSRKHKSRSHPRSRSTASTSSSLSLDSPIPSSSAAASSSSLNLPDPDPQLQDSRRCPSSAAVSTSISPIGDQTRGGPEFVLALHDFDAQSHNATCLTFRAGQVIRVLNRDPSGWWDGELHGQRGWFPSNYVTSDKGVVSLTEEELPSISHTRPKHSHTMSAISATSWSTSAHSSTTHTKSPSSRSGHRPFAMETVDPETTTYCPPIMVNLLHSLTLLQSAVRSNRVAHFQPSTACIISCIRFILSSTECLPRDTPVLKRNPRLAQERKKILSDLASLVSQSKNASAEPHDEDLHTEEVDMMLKLGGQVFAQVRRFLAVAVDCGIDIPTAPLTSSNGASPLSGSPINPSPSSKEHRSRHNSHFVTPQRPRASTTIAPSASRTKSLTDLRSHRGANAPQRDSGSSIAPLLPHRTVMAHSKNEQYKSYERMPKRQHVQNNMSISSISSTSSFSSADSSSKAVVATRFPSGPCTAADVVEALRYTHDQYLSTIAAFIGHVHSHSRSAHASSTGHMYDLVREIVELACKMLTIVEAVMRHADIPAKRVEELRIAKEELYNLTSSLAESVRLLTAPLHPDITEEAEKGALLRSATGALKAGADCVSTIKHSLNRADSSKQFVIRIPSSADSEASAYDPDPAEFVRKSTAIRSVSSKASLSLSVGRTEEGEDATVQPRGLADSQSTVTTSASLNRSDRSSSSTSVESADTAATSPFEASQSWPLEDVKDAVQAKRVDELALESPDNEDDRAFEHSLVEGSVPLSDVPPVSDTTYNSEGHLVAATMDALVERMTPADSLVDPAFSAVFYMTFRLFTTPLGLVDALIDRYNIMPPPSLHGDALKNWRDTTGVPVRLRVSNLVKTWLESYWRASVDDEALPQLEDFARNALAKVFRGGHSQRILDLLQMRRSNITSIVSPKTERIRDPGMALNPPAFLPSEVPRPMMTKALLANLRAGHFEAVAITEFDPLELARQLSIMECELYCAIQPEEVLETGQESVQAPNVKALSSLSTGITGWVAENILDEHDMKKRTMLVKFFIKVANRCSELANFSTSRSILAALDHSTISRLHQTWAGVTQKHKTQLESLRRLADHGRNFHHYRSKLRNTAPPAVPFLGLYLTDVTFCREGNPSFRDSPHGTGRQLVNFNKYHKLARIVQEMQRFQVPYTLKKIPEVQDYLKLSFEKTKQHGDFEDLYQRSLLVEPKQGADVGPGQANDMRQFFNWGRSQQPVTTPS